jgi:glycosyltransferase involved in cell wall biosynthesis
VFAGTTEDLPHPRRLSLDAPVYLRAQEKKIDGDLALARLAPVAGGGYAGAMSIIGAPALTTRQRHLVAVLVPCLNEEPTIGAVINAFRAALPEAAIYVFDNNSTDGTAQEAARAGAIVVPSPRPGKGAVVRHMFRHVDAHIYVMVDGDATYPATAATDLLNEFLRSSADMLVASRMTHAAPGAFRLFHRFGNYLFVTLINCLFHVRLTDVLSGYRVFSREFVKLLPLSSEGFGIETELTLSALDNSFEIRELPVAYRNRPLGSQSKLRTFRDGMTILKAIVSLFRRYKPLVFFASVSVLVGAVAIAAGARPILDYVHTKYVSHLPLAVLAAALGLLAALLLCVGLILEAQAEYHRIHSRIVRALLVEQEGNSLQRLRSMSTEQPSRHNSQHVGIHT